MKDTPSRCSRESPASLTRKSKSVLFPLSINSRPLSTATRHGPFTSSIPSPSSGTGQRIPARDGEFGANACRNNRTTLQNANRCGRTRKRNHSKKYLPTPICLDLRNSSSGSPSVREAEVTVLMLYGRILNVQCIRHCHKLPFAGQGINPLPPFNLDFRIISRSIQVWFPWPLLALARFNFGRD